ncbi:hypothetical protein JOC34_003820 [Virgibacillus halotolerans]|uniref:aspartyl-phosphate phosphatase Spo0E family protein n=1 Tax=Virgibacillus halotolerans TaxID=1071053 RepID=UPI001EF96CA5|nr:aspartyl-phosphate phosphatase Spo0E family protein [Virgibacillus halotolerans]MBM7601399.1 hypothetical protein [Virgibacillus halotolerans]
MSLKETLETQIEQLRLEMYNASTLENNYDAVVHISQELDKLLNELEYIVKQVNKT